ncbi:SusC/RagA family TonB-linked outer membrane protein [Tenacibaculum amylolyticum]|uniref:SusC/RagA family TonB-linked outer membrane protein n=1 Tax=Tenacibaculum amylolyticum TaxID=104269 RepID=UPI0038B52D17
MKTKFNGILTLLLALVVQISFAQERTISGTVSDESGPLPGVSVLKKGTTSGTETDFDGNYSIKAKTGDVLVFSFVGMKTAERVVGSSNNISLTLETDNLLEEIIVVGYGTATKQSYAGTAATVATENLEAKSFSNVSQALAGEVAGVTVINTSGQPGTIGTVRVRGYGSPNGNRSPLYVVDGIPFAGNFDLNSINPADIKSTTVLKDATATAIYGSRGANGVILITTKSGTSSEKSYIEVDVKSGVNAQIIPRYDVIDSPEQWIGLVWEGLYNKGRVNPTEFIPASLGGDAEAFANLSLFGGSTGVAGESLPVGAGAGYNIWNANGAALIDPTTRNVRPGVQRLFTPERYADEAFGEGIRTEANLRMGGGSDKSRYFVSLGYLDDNGYTINSDFRRYTTRLNLTSDVKSWLKVTSNLNYAFSESTNNGQIVGSENVFEFADKMAPLYPVFARFPNTANLIPDPIFGGYQYDYGSLTGLANGFTRNRPNADLLNPIGSAVLDSDTRETHAINGNFNADFKLTDELTFETRFGGQYSYFQRNNVSNHAYGGSRAINGSITVTDQIRWSQTFLQLLRYKTSFGDHSLEVLAAHETFERRFEQASAAKQNVIVPGLVNLSNYLEDSRPATGFANGSAIESYFGQVNYNFANKYYITGSLRTDGSSRFVKDKWGTFGSIGAAWVVSEEDFMQGSFLSYLKVKASWGVTGDQDGAGTASGFDIFNSDLIGGELSLDLNTPGNENLTWETSRMLQGGVELSVGNYIDANFDYYRKETDNLFFNRRVGSSLGIASILVNDGSVLNSGFEFDVTGHLVNNENFKLDLSVNGEVLSNEMLVMPIDPSTGQERIIDTSSSNDGAYAYAAGRSIFDFWMQEWAGVDPADGAPMWFQYYDDKNNNGVLDTGEADFSVLPNGDPSNTSTLYEYRLADPSANIQKTTTKTYADATQVFLDKTLIPDVRGAFRLSGKLGNFDFATQFTYSLGGYAYDNQYAELMSDRFGAGSTNFHVDILNRWQQPGDITDVPLLSDNAVQNITSTSSRFITSTDFIALNNARIGYTVPSNFMQDSGIDAINIWVSGDNLFINTAREGFNPAIRETGSSGRRIYAPATTITMGVRVKF